jgi:hypothetical protein
LFCTLLVLSVNGCPVPEDGVNASYTWYDNRPGGIVVYTCDSGLQRVSGDVTRYCLVNLSWHGLRLVCGNMGKNVLYFVYSFKFSIRSR